VYTYTRAHTRAIAHLLLLLKKISATSYTVVIVQVRDRAFSLFKGEKVFLFREEKLEMRKDRRDFFFSFLSLYISFFIFSLKSSQNRAE